MPPFKPACGRADDAFYFDTEFTSRTPRGVCVYSIAANIVVSLSSLLVPNGALITFLLAYCQCTLVLLLSLECLC